MRTRFFAAALAVLLFFASCTAQGSGETARTEFVLGTVCSVRLINGGDAKALDAVFARLREIDDHMSANKEGTEVAAVNAAAGREPVKVSADTLYVVKRGLEYAALSNGAVDPTVGPLVKLWGIGTEAAHVPAAANIAAARRLVDWHKVRIDEAASTVFLEEKGMALDLGSFAKGYAADEAKRILAARRVKAAIIDLGGNIFAYGAKADGSDWRIGVQDPLSDRGDYIGIVRGKDITVTTAGVYERYFIENGVRYHHILDVSTGAPVRNGLLSATVATSSSTLADGLDTAIFALGREKGLALASSIPGVEALLIDESGRIWLTAGASKIFSLTTSKYKIAE